MTKIAFLFALLTTLLVCCLPAAPAQAQVARTFVSAAGSDSNNCTNVATPCRHLAAAYVATAAHGEIYVLDPANYGSLTITGPVSIEGHGWASISPPSGGNAITINAGPNDAISLSGLTLNGADVANATGIAFVSGGQLEITDCVVRNFAGSGIALAPTSSATITVSRTLAAENGGHGIYLQPSGSPSVHAVFNRVEAYHNAQKGIGIFGNIDSSLLDAVIVDSVAAYNEDGFYALGDSQIFGHVNLRVNRSTTYGNGAGLGAGLRVEAKATAWVSQNDLNESPTPWAEDSTSCILTYGDNYTHAAPPVCSTFPVTQKY